jgi:DNA-binding transcriptional LysR family regulator
MPYGIQAPAVSKQVALLEKMAGERLFNRTPFSLTPAGERIWAKAKIFIGGLVALTEELAQGPSVRIRVTSLEWVLQNHVTELVGFLHHRDVNATFALPPAGQNQMVRWLCDDQIDLAIGPLPEDLPASVDYQPLLELPLALLVQRRRENAAIKTASHFLQPSPRRAKLVCPLRHEAVTRTFMGEMEKRGLDWPVYIEAGSSSSVAKYVADGHGVGVVPNFPDLVNHPKLRALPLEGFPKITIAVMWQKSAGRPTACLEFINRVVTQSWPELCGVARVDG